ncbi:MAG: hypothetical protein QM706_12370 [Nitrospira sp.]
MSGTTFIAILRAGMLALSAPLLYGSGVEAGTELNMTGSGSVTHLAFELPRRVCTDGVDPPYPTRYSNASHTKVTWTCKVGAEDVVIRYSTTNASDSILKVQKPRTDTTSHALFLDHTQTAGCTEPVLVPFPEHAFRKYRKVTQCHEGNTISRPVDLGSTIGAGSFFHRAGLVGTMVQPLDSTNLFRYEVAIVPYSVFVGRQVVDRSPIYPSVPAGPVTSLSQAEIENIFSRRVIDWRALGKGTAEISGVLDGASPITLCLRNAGSVLATAVDAIFMRDAHVTSIATPSVMFSFGMRGVADCLQNNPKSIGVLPAHYAEWFTAPGRAYAVGVDDQFAPSLLANQNKRRALECGEYTYWTNWQFYSREDLDLLHSLPGRYVAAADASYAIVPYGKHWHSQSGRAMEVFRTADAGPLLWKLGLEGTQCSKQ